MTAVLPLTEDEERALRAVAERGVSGAPLWRDVLRLLATLDAERARVRGRAFVPLGTSPLTPEAQAAWDQGMAEREELTRPSPSRSDARRIAAQRGEPTPVFDYPASVVEAVRALEGVRPAMVKARDALSSIGPGPSSERIGPGFPMTWHDWWEDRNEAVRQLNAALASLPKELRDAARAKT